MNTVIGIDYGTQSARAVLIDAANGDALRSHVVRYPHGVMEGSLASAQDYEDALTELLTAVTPPQYRASVRGICVDATSLTLVPLAADGRVLCMLPGLERHPQAQIKLWKRHAAQRQADEALTLAREMDMPFLRRTGGALSCEWTLPKLLEMRDEAPEVYARMDVALDLCEFLTYRLTGRITRSPGSMCFKGLWARDLGLPAAEYLNALRPGFADEYARLLRGDVLRSAEEAGRLRPELCEQLGLKDVVVAAGMLDGHTSPVALGALQPGDATLVAGTSNVLAIQTTRLHEIEGICGIALDGISPGLYGIDSGQSGTGDMLEWYTANAVPARTEREAAERGMNVHQLLAARAERPWECRVAAADWWNGSRNAPCDLSLPGALVGMTLDTRPEDIYLALLQGIVCGTREIMEQCAGYGVRVERLLATGGITVKSPLLMQQYADILGMPVHVGQVAEGPALGAAIYAAVAAGLYDGPAAACARMGVREFTEYRPDMAHRAEYERLYRRNHALRRMIMEYKRAE